MEELYRLSRYGGLADDLVALGVDREDLLSGWKPQAEDIVLLFSGMAVGFIAELGGAMLEGWIISLAVTAILAALSPPFAGIFAFVTASSIDWEWT